jgi:hypothetical protein
MDGDNYKVDLRDPGTLRSVLEGYLRLKVCPVQSVTRPNLMFPATVEMLLPDGLTMRRWGTVIRYMGENGFLVQFDGPLDLTTLEELANLPENPPEGAPAPSPDDRMFVPDPDFEPETHFEPEPTPKPRGRDRSAAPTVEAEAPPRFGPMVDAFVVGPGPDDAAEPPDELPPFSADRTTIHEADESIAEEIIAEEIIAEEIIAEEIIAEEIIAEEIIADENIAEEIFPEESVDDDEATVDGEDLFADLLEESSPEVLGPGSKDEAHMGIPDGWSLESADHTIPPGELEIAQGGTKLTQTAQGDAAPEPYDLEMTQEDSPDHPFDDRGPRPALSTTEMSAVYNQIAGLSPSEKQRLARSGNRITRGLLIKDRNKNIHQFVVRNPKITVEEIAEFAKLPGLSKDAIRIIASSRTWLASRQVVMGLVRNPATPADLLPGLIQRLGPGQWAVLAKSGDVRTQVSSLARKLLLASRG